MQLRALAFFWVLLAASPPLLRAAEIDQRPLNLKIEVAFPDLKWTAWQSVEETGRDDPLRPILLTAPTDKSNRVVVPTQQGVVHIFPNDQAAKQTSIFLNLEPKVAYHDKTNEEGVLGLAFHPQYATNGQLFIYYTNKHKPHQNLIARFRVSKDDPNRADPASEEVILTIDKPFWNHDGGTIVFGPDGYLYVAVGDGGLANDPYGNGQKLTTLLGKILRIDVDHAQDGKPYAIPRDNPFAGRADARPEIWALGLRNVWRMAFDPATNLCWAADVGQETWEEINLIVHGGNYGWNVREGFHPFVRKGGTPAKNVVSRPDMVDPIWEYHHDVGKSITGGMVYRGKQIPELVGGYLYADYVTGKMWALFYDEASRKVTANREVPLPRSIPVMSFGEDATGEAYFMTYASDGRGLFRIAK